MLAWASCHFFTLPVIPFSARGEKGRSCWGPGRGENNQEGRGTQQSNTLGFRKSLPTFWRTEIVILKNVWPRCQKVCYEKWRE